VHRLVTFILLAMFATAGEAAERVKIGFLTTLSGPGGALGVDIRDGFQLGLRHTGDKLGGLPVELTVLDDQQSPDVARQAVERLLKQQRVDAMTGVVFSSVLLPILPGILQSETFYISPNTGPLDYAGEKCNPYFFVSSWQNEDIPGAMGKFATDRGYKSVYLIAPNYPGGRESIAGFKRMFKGQIADEVYTRMGQLDYAAELAVMRAARPDAVFMFLPGGMGVNFIKQFNAGGLNKAMALLVPGFSADEDTIRAVGEGLLGAFNSSQWAADLDNAPNRRFVADFQKLHGRMPTMYAAQGYDTALLLDAAVRDAKGRVDDKSAVRAALEAATSNPCAALSASIATTTRFRRSICDRW
jgi:branched-chain amino acid transport system substrate-binding protein